MYHQNLKDIISVIDNQPALDSLVGISQSIIAAAIEDGITRVPLVMQRFGSRIALYRQDSEYYIVAESPDFSKRFIAMLSDSDLCCILWASSMSASLDFRVYDYGLLWPFGLAPVAFSATLFGHQTPSNIPASPSLISTLPAEAVFENSLNLNGQCGKIRTDFCLSITSSILITVKHYHPMLFGATRRATAQIELDLTNFKLRNIFLPSIPSDGWNKRASYHRVIEEFNDWPSGTCR